MDINYEKKISTRSSEEMKYDKNKDFSILRDFIQENLMKTYYPKMKMYLRKNYLNKKLNINVLNNYIEKENKKFEREIKDSTNSYERKGKKT